MPDHTARRNPARAGIMAAATAALLLLATSTASAKTVTIAAVNFRFLPASQTVNVGDVVRWTFAGDPHTVTSGSPGALDGRFDSGIQNPGGSFQFTFDTAGTFPYFCQIHPEQMFGTIVVKASASPSPTVQTTTSPAPSPTLRPTVTPTSTPAPTLAPTVAPTLAPTLAPTPEPTPEPTLTAQPSESAPSIPVASLTAGPSEALLETPLPSSVPTTPGPGAVAPTSAIDPAPIVALLVVLGILVGGGLIVARRRRVR